MPPEGHKWVRINIFTKVLLILSFASITPLIITSILVILTYQDVIDRYLMSGQFPISNVPAELSLTVQNVRIQVFLVILLVSLITIFLSSLISRSFSYPLRKLYAGTMDISKGNLGVRIDIRSSDEIGELASSFNDMAAALAVARNKIEEYSRTLEEKILERTKELKEAGEFTKNVLSNMAEGLFVMDMKGNITEFNNTLLNLLDYKREEIIGKNIFSAALYLPSEKGRVMNTLSTALKSGVLRSFELSVLSKGGKELPVRISASTIKGAEDVPIAFVGVIHDMSGEREIEKMKSELLSNISHELRTPLTSIQGFTSTLLSAKEVDDKTRMEFLRIIEEESGRLGRIISDLLDISRIEAGWVKLNRQSCQLIDVVKSVLNEYEIEAKSKEVMLRVILPEHLSSMLLDGRQMEQAIGHLLSNAIKFSNPGGRVTLVVAENKDEIAITIEDTGLGIPKEAIPRVFDRFYKIHRPGIETRGIGLGLTLVKYIVEGHGGTIHVESEEGKGSSFALVLPKAKKT